MIIFYILVFLLQHYLFLYNNNILQKQFYEVNRFVFYCRQNYKLLIFNNVFFILSLIFIPINKYFCFLFVLFFFRLIKNKIIKFKITNRIIRHFIVFELINIVCFVSSFFTNTFLFVLVSYFLFWISFFFSILDNSCISVSFTNCSSIKISQPFFNKLNTSDLFYANYIFLLYMFFYFFPHFFCINFSFCRKW